MSLFKRKRLLHPNLHNGGFDCGSGNEEYVGGCLSLFGIQIDFDWNDKLHTWEISCPHELTARDITASLEGLFSSLKEDKVYDVFSSESQITLEGFAANNPPNKIFWSDEGERYLFAKKHLTQDMYICIKLKEQKKGKKYRGPKLTQEVRIFNGADIVFSYPGEYHGEIQLHASQNGAD